MAMHSDERFGAGRFVTVHRGTQRPQVSILMPVYMQAEFITAAVSSVLQQEGCACEVIISDDASTDGTFELAYEAVERLLAGPGREHTVVMRRGGNRLFREHFALLSDAASCDVVVMAHGDDVARPHRAARLVQALTSHNAAAAASTFDVIDATGGLVEVALPVSTRQPAPSLEEVIAGPDWLIGSSMAWRRSALAAFPRLDSRAVPTGHDRIMGLRAWLAGGVVSVDEPLFSRRSHAGNWSRHLVDRRIPDALEFGWALNTWFLTEAMLDDVDTARSVGLIEADVAERADTVLQSRDAQSRSVARTSYARLTCQGLTPVWVDEATFREANDAVSGIRPRQRPVTWPSVRGTLSAGLRAGARFARPRDHRPKE